MVSYTTTLTSKGQFTVPKPIRDRLAVQKGAKFKVFYQTNGFVAKPEIKSDFLSLEGMLEKYDDGTPTAEIIERALIMATKEITDK